MTRLLALLALFGFLAAPSAVRAADAKAAGPTFMLRVQSINDMLDNGEYIAGLVGQEDAAKQLLGFARALGGDKKVLEGVDMSKPFAVYAYLADEITKSEAVAMLPIGDKDAFMGLLKGRLGLEVTDEKGGLYSVESPNNSGTIFFRFENGYVYGTYLNKDNVAVAKLPKPADVIGKDYGVLSLSFRVDRLPDEMKKFAMGAVETALAEAKNQPVPNETPAIKAIKEKSIDSLAAAVKSVLYDGEEVTLKIDVNPKKDELALEMAMTAKKGSTLAKEMQDIKARKSVAFGALSTKDTAFLMGGNMALPASIKTLLGPAIDDLVKLGLKEVPADAIGVVEPVLKGILPTLKAGDLDGGFALIGPTTDGKYTGLSVGKVANGKDFEKSIKEAVGKLPAEYKDLFKLDAETVDGVTYHMIKVQDKLDEKTRKTFGDSDVWLAFRDDAAMAAFGPQAKDVLKAALKSSPKADSVMKMELSVARLIPAAEVANEKTAKQAAKKVFGNDLTGDTFTLSFDAGDSIRMRAALKGKVIKFGMLMSEMGKMEN